MKSLNTAFSFAPPSILSLTICITGKFEVSVEFFMKYSIFFRDSTHILLTRDFISMMKEVPLYHQMNGGIHMNQLVTGKFIALKRKQKNLTQEQLAEKLGVSNKAISKWETGKCMPDYSIIKSLCEELEVTVEIGRAHV